MYTYNYSFVKQYADRALLRRIDKAARNLSDRIVALDLASVGISEYNQRYIRNKFKSPIGCMQKYAYLLAMAIGDSDKPLQELTVVDYGGGNGLFGLLAKEVGVGTVIYNDIYDVSCADIVVFADALGLALQDIVHGDLPDLIGRVQEKGYHIDAVVSYDVIEHIYDIDGYFRQLHQLGNAPLRIVFGSAANTENPDINAALVAHQHALETTDREKVWGHKERDSLASYHALRCDIINALELGFSAEEVEQLATDTRGLIKADIEAQARQYKETGKLSYQPTDTYNTCDPMTGNWAEHLLPFDHVQQVLNDGGFDTQILPGFQPYSFLWRRRMYRHGLNALISLMGRQGLRYAPYYIVMGSLREKAAQG
ncbi:hypothetical protein LJ739_02525 [Aestuariibacter halophilus]|uniref:Class I SAM-dependent methyltransferase n=1 Tax=Fluctibacter halophilus TaxID=226011 RepID=A0ABS8G3E4_9ALTE|nr:methyltransferase domain-containing protein [Aestuariibacter halophilus]MCC2615117.1 hypothetical protein [Aestuariibacter halophilus]